MRQWLRSLREQKQLTQAVLAKKVDVDITAIGKYESGARRPSPEVAQKLASVLEFDWTRFFENA